MTLEPRTPGDDLIDRFWDYLHGELDAQAAHDLQQQLLADKHAAKACRDLVEVMVMAQDAFKREGAAMHELSQLTGPQLLAELARRESLAQATLANLSEPTVLHLKGQATHDKISLTELRSAGSYLFTHGVKSKAAMIGGVAAAILLAVVLAVSFIGEPVQDVAEQPAQQDLKQSPGQIVATLAAQQDARWAEPNITNGQPLHTGQRLTLIRGRAEIRTTAGAIAVLEAPVSIELIDHDNALRLTSGKLVGICETQASKGFLVRTPHADVIDLGTRFGVEVMPYRATEVHVYLGEVLVRLPQANATKARNPRRVLAGSALRADASTQQVTAIPPAFGKFSEQLATRRLPGSGVGLAEGAVVPNWQIIEDANGPLDVAPPLIVQHSKSKQYPHFEAPGNDPDRAQWLFFGGGNSAYYPFEPIPGLELSRLLIEGRVELPAPVDLAGKVLYLRYGYNEALNSLHINDQPIELPKYIGGPDRPLFYEIELPIDQAGLRHGENVVLADLKNQYTEHLVSFYFYWEVRPAKTLAPNTGETQP